MPIIDRNSAKAKICPLNLHLLFCDFPCWYVTWAQIVKLQNGISSRRQKVPGPKDEIISGFAIPLFAPSVLLLAVCESECVPGWTVGTSDLQLQQYSRTAQYC